MTCLYTYLYIFIYYYTGGLSEFMILRVLQFNLHSVIDPGVGVAFTSSRVGLASASGPVGGHLCLGLDLAAVI